MWNLFGYICLVLDFVTFWYFSYFVKFICCEMPALRLWKSLLLLAHSIWAFACVFVVIRISFKFTPIDFITVSVLRFPALLSSVLRKPVIWTLSQFNWLLPHDAGSGCGGISEQITNSFISFLFMFTCPLLLYSSFADIFSVPVFRQYLLVLIGLLTCI